MVKSFNDNANQNYSTAQGMEYLQGYRDKKTRFSNTLIGEGSPAAFDTSSDTTSVIEGFTGAFGSSKANVRNEKDATRIDAIRKEFDRAMSGYADAQKQLMEETHKVLAQNRMGYRLSSTIVVTAPQLLSQLILPGMVQLTPSGEILIATADCQVSGGYLQVLCLSEEALAVLVQKREGEQLTFRNTLPQKQP